mmetsp:Transcript_22985/g.43424  ORF Transcript_22985/g.43424 Transcript_22985/m.43424 type:complete len:89 (+) Transcript_22985:471-737(+)
MILYSSEEKKYGRPSRFRSLFRAKGAPCVIPPSLPETRTIRTTHGRGSTTLPSAILEEESPSYTISFDGLPTAMSPEVRGFELEEEEG